MKTSDMPSYKLTYFDFRARGELSRIIFHLAGVQFEDERIAYADWPKVKPTTPSGHLPYLTVDGDKILYQSDTIARYLAKEFGLAGKNNWEQAQADLLVDNAKDMTDPFLPFLFVEKDENKKDDFRRSYETNKLPAHLDNFEKLLEQSKGDFFSGDEITWGDLAVMNAFQWMETKTLAIRICLDEYPKLKAFYSRIQKLPKIAEYLEQRPALDF